MSELNYRIRGTKVISPYPVRLTPAETRLIFSLQKVFSPEDIFADCYFPSTKHSTDQIQIDCLAINQQGIFVFESKDYGGWIYGNGKQRYWTQTLNFGHEKHRFYNPILQNLNHIKSILDIIPNVFSIHSIIVFGNNSTLKEVTHIPEDCYICLQSQVIPTITQIKSSRLLQESEITVLRHNIIKARTTPNTITRSNHIQEIQDFTNQNPKI